MEFPQAPVEKELYLKTPKVFEIDTKGYISEHVLKVHKNVYEQKQYGRLWYQYLSRKNNEGDRIYTFHSGHVRIIYKKNNVHTVHRQIDTRES